MKPIQLLDRNTHNTAKNSRVCWQQRPCYRVHECRYCWNKQRKFFIDQLKLVGTSWGLQQFITISFIASNSSPELALAELSLLRSKLHPRLFRGFKFVSQISIAVNKTNCTPHFHILTNTNLFKKDIGSALSKIQCPFSSWSINIQSVMNPKRINLAKIGGYLMDQNYLKSLGWRYSRCRLITASRGMRTGRPCALDPMTIAHMDFTYE